MVTFFYSRLHQQILSIYLKLRYKIFCNSGSSTDCVIADSTNSSFNQKTVSCSSQASYLCEAWRPPCPDGYTWVPRSGNASCFRVRSGGYQSASLYWHSITTAEKICMEDGTRLSSPDQDSQYTAVRNWLFSYKPYMEVSGDSASTLVWSGYRKLKQSILGLENSSVISPWYSNISTVLPVSGYVTNTTSGYLLYGCMYQHMNSTRLGYNCLNADVSDTRAVCEYRHCTTVSGKYCVFPFKIGGRQYDTCVPFGRADGSAWCATSVDPATNVLTNETCATTCPVSTCPVGFTAVLQTCIHISATHPYDTVKSVQEAENVCMSMGARLYQPRSMKSIRTLLFMNQPLFNKNYTVPNSLSNGLLDYDPAGNLIALGISGYQRYAFTYRDGSPFPDSLVDVIQYGFAWGLNYPDESDDQNNCVVLQNKQEFANVPCGDYAVGLADGMKLSYICEARSFVTVDGLDPNMSCVFPFKANATDDWHLSCIYGTNTKVSNLLHFNFFMNIHIYCSLG